jgi:hypothetical protein
VPRLCGPPVGLSTSPPPAEVGLAATADSEAATVLDPMRESTSMPANLHAIAGCVRQVVNPEIPPQIDARGRVTLHYVCGRRYTVHNGTHLTLPLAGDVPTTGERFTLTIFPGADHSFAVATVNAVQLSLNGTVLASATNGGVVCSN